MERKRVNGDLLRVMLSGQADLLGEQAQQSWQWLYLDSHGALTFLLLTSSVLTGGPTSPWAHKRKAGTLIRAGEVP